MYKSGEKSEIGNYRPISILSTISKLLKKLFFPRTAAFFEKHTIILQIQYEFRANHSTTHALLDVITSSFDNINYNNYTALYLFLDLKKAFGTVNRDILLHKLECYGVRGVAHGLFSSFPFKRFQYVRVENELSSFKKCDCGIPQGSVQSHRVQFDHLVCILMTSVAVQLIVQDCLLMIHE